MLEWRGGAVVIYTILLTYTLAGVFHIETVAPVDSPTACTRVGEFRIKERAVELKLPASAFTITCSEFKQP